MILNSVMVYFAVSLFFCCVYILITVVREARR